MYPNAFYRVSVKALIRDDAGNVLVVKENQDTWSLPGGGIDHGEVPEVALLRELKEELGVG
ncbi:MAG: NUDIX hydrolase, partial [Alcaligenaceae bacterium]